MNRDILYHEEEVFYKKHNKEKQGMVAKKLVVKNPNKRLNSKVKKHKITNTMLGKI